MASRQQPELMQRLADLESQLAFQEDTIETLNQLVTQQAAQLDELQRKFSVVINRVQQLHDNQGPSNSNPADEIPPHY
ncbi:MAG: Protein SlyX [Pseudidiomarina mangrovi]|nr:MAG: Protein SlyX [Pseudidiomarina mangrovi]